MGSTIIRRLCSAALFVVLIWAADGVRGEVASTTLRELTARANAIAIARVDKVERIGGVRVARATVLRPLKGLAARQQFAFLAQGTWTCDESYAVQGETALIFLGSPATSGFARDFLRMRPWFEFLRARRLRGIPFYRIAHSGAGRMPIVRKNGKRFFTARSRYGLESRATTTPNSRALQIGLVRLPPGIRVVPDGSVDGLNSYLVPLWNVEDAVRKYVKATKYAKLMLAEPV
jgi:hypothetical protein